MIDDDDSARDRTSEGDSSSLEEVTSGVEEIPPADPDDPLPRRLGRYELVKRVGAGGMARVYMAKQEGPAGFQKTVVVKLIHPQLSADRTFVQLFLREATLAARLQHSNIVQVLELGQEDGVYYLTMEHVEGITLQRLAHATWGAGRSLPMELVVTAIADAALGLHYAHHHVDERGAPAGVVHRDVSPDNLIIGVDATTKILDFGIARPVAPDASKGLTQTGTIKGKVPFLAPEQLKGLPIDGRVDLYALGVSLYWLITGQRPFRGKTDFEIMSAIMHDEPARPSSINPNVPALLDSIVMRLLDKEPAARIATGNELHEMLAPVLPARARWSPFLEPLIRSRDLPTGSVTDGNVAATPLTGASGAWARPPVDATLEDAVRPDGANTTSDVTRITLTTVSTALPASPLPDEPTFFQGPRGPGRRKAAAAGAVAAGALALVFVAVRASSDPAPVAEVEHPPADVEHPPADVEHIAAPSTTAPLSSTTAPVAPAPPDEPSAPDPVARHEPPERRASSTSAPKPVSAKAPATIAWLSPTGATLGRGNCALALAADVKSVTAFDTRRLVKSTVAVNARSVDYGSLPHGKLEVRVYPYADVTLGKESLGATPLDPVDVVAGDYEVTVVGRDGKRVKQNVTVAPKKSALVKVDLTKVP